MPITTNDLLKVATTDRQREVVNSLALTGSQVKAAASLGMSHSSVHKTIQRLTGRLTDGVYSPASKTRTLVNDAKLDTSARLKQVKRHVSKKGASVYVITCAQNATPIHEAGMASLLGYCTHNGAELIVIPNRYHNATSQWTTKDESNEWWAGEIMPYLLDHRVELCKNLVILGDIRILPTASRPTSGMETFCGGKSVIIGHQKIEQVTIPSPQNSLPKVVATTGCITIDNYTDSKSGKKGEHHHTFGALVVEVDGDSFYMRQLNMDSDGSFYDLDKLYSGGKIKTGVRAAGLVLGDLHQRFVDPGVVSATFDAKNSIVNTIRPRAMVYHDVVDFYSQNHHHRGKPFTKLAKHIGRQSSVSNEINECAEFIDAKTRKGQRVIFAASNHPDAMVRWIDEADWKYDPENAVLYLETALMMARSVRMTTSGAAYDDPFVYWMRKKLKCVKQCLFPCRDESVQIEGIEVGMHGDKGSNGARGSIRNFGRMGVKSVIGHSHTPGVIDGVYQTGTSSALRLEYNSGPSSWMHCHCIIYPNGKRTLVNIINGQWRYGR